MKFHLATFLVASKLLVLIRDSHGLLMQPLKNPESTCGRALLKPSRSASSTSGISVSQCTPSSPNLRFRTNSISYSSALYADKSDDRIFSAGGGVPQIPSGELKLFDPGEQGMKGGTLDLAERLKNGVSYHQDEGSETSSDSSSQEELELSLFDPGQEGMKGGTSDFAERLKGGANFQEQQVTEQPTATVSQSNGAATSSSPEPVAAEATTPEVSPAPAQQQQPNNSEGSTADNAGRRAYWPYQPSLSSFSSPAYPNVGVGRGRAAAIRKHYQEGIRISSVPSTTTTTTAQTSPATEPQEIITTTTTNSTNGSPVAANFDEREKHEMTAALWGKQINWWDNAGGTRLA
mmetsp:Transcript_39369/g.95294  ORF Transcript_39369/g.95294 Transcript_39369/m.95294 type:complete len:348 (-) Transcript_39369:129-1172(-)